MAAAVEEGEGCGGDDGCHLLKMSISCGRKDLPGDMLNVCEVLVSCWEGDCGRWEMSARNQAMATENHLLSIAVDFYLVTMTLSPGLFSQRPLDDIPQNRDGRSLFCLENNAWFRKQRAYTRETDSGL